ncbi:nucleolar protein 6-like [Salvia divinorum]|uniref:Nucleolar protein 6-like n=1 Tax=Salvia divinorum TaxID=28513 RepID=A0ABD1H4D4_SALDI
MASVAEINESATSLKYRELLKEVQLDYSPENTSIVDSVVSAIRDAVDSIPDGLPVTFWIAQLSLCYCFIEFCDAPIVFLI